MGWYLSRYFLSVRSSDDSSTRIKRKLPAHLKATAAANPGGWIAEIDGDQVTDPDGNVPPEAIRGLYEVGKNGKATGWYQPNPNFGTVQDDLSQLASADAMYQREPPENSLFWLPGTPSDVIKGAIAEMLSDQVSGARLNWLKITEQPTYLAAGPRSPENERIVTIRRSALAVEFMLSVSSAGRGIEILRGTFTWVAESLDIPGTRRDRTWLDFDLTIAQAKELLGERMFHPDGDAPSE